MLATGPHKAWVQHRSYRRAAKLAASKLSLQPEGGFADPSETSKSLAQIIEQRSTFRQHISHSLPESGEQASAPLLNPTCLEMYLSEAEFMQTFGRDKSAFYALPQWKQRDLKRKANLF